MVEVSAYKDTGIKSHSKQHFYDMMSTSDREELRKHNDTIETYGSIVNMAQVVVIGWGMSNDMEFIASHLAPFHHILDLQIVAVASGYPAGLAACVLEMFAEAMDKRYQRCDWGRRPLSRGQMEYSMSDATWLPRIFHQLKAQIREEHFAASKENFDKHSHRTHIFNPRDWGLGDKSESYREIMHVVWRVREERAASLNHNVGRIIPNGKLKELTKRLHDKWFNEGDHAYGEFITWAQFAEHLNQTASQH